MRFCTKFHLNQGATRIRRDTVESKVCSSFLNISSSWKSFSHSRIQPWRAYLKARKRIRRGLPAQTETESPVRAPCHVEEGRPAALPSSSNRHQQRLLECSMERAASTRRGTRSPHRKDSSRKELFKWNKNADIVFCELVVHTLNEHGFLCVSSTWCNGCESDELMLNDIILWQIYNIIWNGAIAVVINCLRRKL